MECHWQCCFAAVQVNTLDCFVMMSACAYIYTWFWRFFCWSIPWYLAVMLCVISCRTNELQQRNYFSIWTMAIPLQVIGYLDRNVGNCIARNDRIRFLFGILVGYLERNVRNCLARSDHIRFLFGVLVGYVERNGRNFLARSDRVRFLFGVLVGYLERNGRNCLARSDRIRFLFGVLVG